MKSQLIAIVAALLVVGCGTTPSPELPTAKAPDISIHEAVGTGNIEAVKKHLAAGTDVNANDGGWTPLWYAADEGHKEIVELLIAKGADVNAKNKGDVTPLYGAARSGRKEVAELLIAKGADVNARDDVGRIPLHIATGGDHLHWAAVGGQNEIVKLLIAKGADVNAKDYAGVTPLDYAEGETADLLRKHGGKTKKELEAAGKSIKRIAEAAKPKPPTGKAPDIDIHFAAMIGNLEAVKQHITAGADVNAIDDDRGMTPLIIAAGNGHKEIVVLLITEGADVNAKDDKFGMTPLLMAVVGIETVLAPVEKEIVELLIAKGADVNALIVSGPSEFKGKTPLDLAKRHPELTDLLRKHGGKTGEELKGGEPVAEASKPEPTKAKAQDISIIKAAQEGNIEAVKQHLAAGADVNAKDENEWTPLNSAAVAGRNQIVKLLIEKGADLNAGNPLIAAAGHGHMEVIELLIANGADVNAKANDQLGGMALHMTANLGHKKIVELLVAAGADVNAKMLHGMTPLHFAANNKGIAKFLIDKGADVNAKLNDGPHNGFTPLDFANLPNLSDPETVDLLRKHGGKTGAELEAEAK
jgi:ankyrin repeat protein